MVAETLVLCGIRHGEGGTVRLRELGFAAAEMSIATSACEVMFVSGMVEMWWALTGCGVCVVCVCVTGGDPVRRRKGLHRPRGR